MSTSSKQIDAVFRGEITSLLRHHGFKKDGRTFRKWVDSRCLIVNVQASLGNSWDSARFYINLAIYSPELAAATGLPSHDKPKEYEGQRRKRLEPAGAGWWTLTPDSDVYACSADIASLLEREGLPWLEQMSDQIEHPSVP